MLPALLPAALQQHSVTIAPQIPAADRTAPGRIFLDHADRLFKNAGDSFMILVGDVVFTRGAMIMRCDSAHYVAESESMDAFGNVSMEQGDTLFVFADELNYRGDTELATLYADYGRKVRLINRDVELETDIFYYDMAAELGYYQNGGRLFDPSNDLTSRYGEYSPTTKEAHFRENVHLFSRDESDTLDIFSEDLYYNTNTGISELTSPSTIVNARGTIYTSMGVYDTRANTASLFDRSVVVTRNGVEDGPALTADTIFYDRDGAFGQAFGAVVLADSANNSELRAEYGYYDQRRDSAFVTGRAQLLQFSQADTLYLHGRYISSWTRVDSVAVDSQLRADTTHVAVIYPRVRFYKRDMQGVCDSMRFTEADSMMRMFVNPVVWSDDQQIFGNVIEVLLNDSTIERAILPDQAFTTQHIEGEHYNQMAGKVMTADFVAGELTHLYIDGNVQIIMYPQENDSTYNKIVNAESSFLDATFSGRRAETIKIWPQTTGTVTPLFLARRSLYKLPKFQWYGSWRPTSPPDIFNVPDDFEALMLEQGRPVPDAPPIRMPRIAERPIRDTDEAASRIAE